MKSLLVVTFLLLFQRATLATALYVWVDAKGDGAEIWCGDSSESLRATGLKATPNSGVRLQLARAGEYFVNVKKGETELYKTQSVVVSEDETGRIAFKASSGKAQPPTDPPKTNGPGTRRPEDEESGGLGGLGGLHVVAALVTVGAIFVVAGAFFMRSRSKPAKHSTEVRTNAGSKKCLPVWLAETIPSYWDAENAKFHREGGVAWIFLSRNRKLNRMTVLKVLKPQSTEGQQLHVPLFENEYAVMKHLEGSGVQPEVFGRHMTEQEDRKIYWYEMEYLDESQWMPLLDLNATRKGPITTEVQLQKALQMVAALVAKVDTLHSRHVIHADLSPHNIMIKRDAVSEVRVIDFGTAYCEPLKHFWLNISNDRICKLNYGPPEQWSGGIRKINESADWYAMGITAWEIICGEVPFKTRAEHLQAPRVVEPLLQCGLTEERARMIAQMMSPDPSRRPSGSQILKILG